jgi:CDP-glycerol glycerophosphotransferase (TagB/SpsB family)
MKLIELKLFKMIYRYLKYMLFLFYLPFWHFQKILLRNKKVWVFGAWFGMRYTDNAKNFFEYIVDFQDNINPIWITKNREVYQVLRREGKTCYMKNSFKGIYTCLKAGVFVFSSGKFDINPFLMNGAKSVQVWHGAPMKKIGLEDKFSKSLYNDRLRKYFFPFDWEYNYDAFVSTAKIFNKSLCSAFDLKENQIITSGYPRNDVFFDENQESKYIEKLNEEFENPKIILYLPTFRDDESTIDLFFQYKFETKEWFKYLESTNTIFVYKNHFAGEFSEDLKFSNNRIVRYKENEESNLNLFMKRVDVLITDYSGAYFDFKLTNKPIILAPFDLEDYINNSRELYFDYNEIDEYKGNNWVQILNLLKSGEVFNNRKNKLEYNDFIDGDSSKRLYSEIIKRFELN